MEDGREFCEEGIDCGGPCRPCDSCENGIQDWTETGLDCGGLYCPPCTQPPVIHVPLPVCRKDINPLRNDLIFFLLIMLVIIVGRVWYGIRQLKESESSKETTDVDKAKTRYRIKRDIYTFVGIILAITIILYFYYYYFVLCEAEPKYLWWLLFLLLVVPLAVWAVIRRFEYNEKAKLRKLERALDAHRKHLIRLVEIENSALQQLEKELGDDIYRLLHSKELGQLFNDFPDLAAAYRNMMSLYERYRDHENPFELERELCEQVYRLETDKQFTALAKERPEVGAVYKKLRLLYQHYETKQQLYDLIDKDDARIEQDVASVDDQPAPPPLEDEGDEGEGFQGSGSEEEGEEQEDDGEKKG
jgi:hypothetical protein